MEDENMMAEELGVDVTTIRALVAGGVLSYAFTQENIYYFSVVAWNDNVRRMRQWRDEGFLFTVGYSDRAELRGKPFFVLEEKTDSSWHIAEWCKTERDALAYCEKTAKYYAKVLRGYAQPIHNGWIAKPMEK